MPTLLVLTLAVVALLPLTTSRPSTEYVDGTRLFPSDASSTMDTLRHRGCIDDSTLIDRLQTCMQRESYLEENKQGNAIYFGLLDDDWHRLQLLQREFPENVFLKVKLVRVFRELLTSFYLGQFAKLNNPIETYENASKIVAEVSESLGESPLYPTVTDELPSEGGTSNETIYEQAGSDPEHSYVSPASEYGSNIITLDVDGLDATSGTPSDKNSYEDENNEIQKSIYEQEVTTSELDRVTKKASNGINSLDSDSYHSTTYVLETTTILPLEESGTRHETPTTNQKIFESSENGDIKRTDMGSDIDENELFQLINMTTTSEPNDTNVISKKGKMDNIDYNTSSDEHNNEGIQTEISYNSSQDEKSIPNDGTVTQNHDEQTTDLSLNHLNRNGAMSKAPTTSDHSYVTSTAADSEMEEKKNYLDTEVTSDQVTHSVYEIFPIDPIVSPYVSHYNTPSYAHSDNKNMEPLSTTPNLDSTYEKQNIASTTGTYSDYERFEDNQPSTNLPASQMIDEVEYTTEGYKNINKDYPPTQTEDPKIFATVTSTASNHAPSIYLFSSSAVPSDSKSGGGESKDYQTETSTIDATVYSKPGETTSPIDSVTNTFGKIQPPTDVASTQGADSKEYDEYNTSYDVKGITMTLDTAITSQEPEFKDSHEHGHVVIDNEIGSTSLSPTVSGNESDRKSQVPDDIAHKDTTTDHAIAVSQTVQSKSEDGISIYPGTEYDQQSTSAFEYGKSITKIIYKIESTTEKNILPIINRTSTDPERGDRTNSLNELHSFSIPFPEVKKEKQANVIVNTLRVFPVDNDHMVMFQQSNKRGCLSNNDCVRVGNVVNRDAKQRRAPLLRVVGKGEDQHLQRDLDSVLWWHKMRALKKKSR